MAFRPDIAWCFNPLQPEEFLFTLLHIFHVMLNAAKALLQDFNHLADCLDLDWACLIRNSSFPLKPCHFLFFYLNISCFFPLLFDNLSLFCMSVCQSFFLLFFSFNLSFFLSFFHSIFLSFFISFFLFFPFSFFFLSLSFSFSLSYFMNKFTGKLKSLYERPWQKVLLHQDNSSTSFEFCGQQKLSSIL